jgi:hypothetical protein
VTEREHPFEAMHVEHVRRQRDRASVVDARGAVTTGESEQS